MALYPKEVEALLVDVLVAIPFSFLDLTKA
jgi:hypothetical protein